MGRRGAQKSFLVEDTRYNAFRRSQNASQTPKECELPARSRREVDDEDYADSEPNEKGGDFADKFLAIVERTMQQKRRAWLDTLLELVVPFFFIVGAIILWASMGDKKIPEKQELDVASVSTLSIVDYYKSMTCNTASSSLIPGVISCAEVSYEYDCDGDESRLPVKGLCFDKAIGADQLLGYYMNSMLANAFRVPSLNTVIMMQWIAQKRFAGKQDVASAAALAAAGLVASNRYNAIMNSGKVYLTPNVHEITLLHDCLVRESELYPLVYGGTFETVEDAENHVKTTPGPHWAILEVNGFSNVNLELVIHMNKTSLPPLDKVVDDQYAGGYSFDRADMYVASGFSTLQEMIYKCHLNIMGYTQQDNLHPYPVSLGSLEYRDKMLLKTAPSVVAFMVVLSFLYPVSQLTKNIVLEKELRIREAMLIMGLSNTPLYFSWFVVYALQYFVVCIVIVILLKLTLVPSSDAFVLFSAFYLFAITTIPLSGLIAAFFSKARLASMLTPLIYFVLSAPTFSFDNASENLILGLCVFSPSAFASVLTNIFLLEVSTGFGPKDFTNPRLRPATLTLYIFLAADFVAYSILMLYLDAVLPKDWGTTRHPLFFIIDPVKALFRCHSDTKAPSLDNQDGRAETGLFEQVENRESAVRIEGLRKEYSRGGKKFVAVNNLYWNINENEISVLLGHNGAGKTTAMNMMTGMVSADSGDCYVNGYSVRTDLDKVRQHIGYCPQHNILWDELTCREHLEFYGRIKGIYGAALENAVRLILREVDLLKKIECKSGALSGGQKRKLSVAIAFVGRSRLVFLDEPTAGMDVSARRYTWELLRRMCEKHSILLTTHYMDEADLLGHKIGIMSRGSLQCSGSSVFLKSRLGLGYNMTVSIDPEAEAEDVDRLVLSLLPSAESTDYSGSDIVYKLPMRDVHLLPSFLSGLEKRGEEAGVRGYSLSAATLEEVFRKIVLDDIERHQATDGDKAAIQEESNAVWNCEMTTSSGQRLFTHFKYMLLKRLWCALRDRKMQCFQFVCPMLCILLAMLISLYHFSQTSSLNITAEMFGEPIETLISGCEELLGETNGVVREGAYLTDLNFDTGLDLSIYATDTAKQHTKPRYTSIFCGDRTMETVIPGEQNTIYFFYNTSAYHSAALVLQQFYTYVFQHVIPAPQSTLATIIKTLPESTENPEVRGGVQGILIGAIIMIPFTLLPSNPVAWIVKESECKARHLQMISGLSFYIYWIANFIFDFMAYTITLTLVMIIFLIFRRAEYVSSDSAGATITMFLTYGASSTAGAYLFSFAFDEHSTAQSATMAINFVSGFILVMLVFILSLLDSTKDVSDVLRWPFRLVPSYCVGECIINLSVARQQSVAGLQQDPWGMSIIGWPCVFMAVEVPIFLVLIFFLDHPRRRRGGERSSYERNAPAELIADEDSDVEDERKEVYRQEGENVNVDVVRVVDLRKVYNNGKAAVRNLSFSILPDEVFGFLGTNGAGKTTTMSMLCQEFIPSSGNAYICGYDIVEESEEALRCIGYCPQFDATLDLLTVEEHLYLYAGIRCILHTERTKVVNGLMRLCEILQYRHTTSAQLSGGNRRKLSVAIALMGSPQVVLLDEPSAGMDPVARRGLWTTIKKVSQNCSVVLTTHHLEEVEELADTVAIMADGALRCIGDKIHLKQKYGSGFEMNIRISKKEMRGYVQKFVEKYIPDAMLNEFKGQRFVFALPQETVLSEAFLLLEQNKERLQITDYSISQTSIEQVFLRISEQQEMREDGGADKRALHFGKSHASLHHYHHNTGDQGGGTGAPRVRNWNQKTVLITSEAMDSYRRRNKETLLEDVNSQSAATSRRTQVHSDDEKRGVTTVKIPPNNTARGSSRRDTGNAQQAPLKRKGDKPSVTLTLPDASPYPGSDDPSSNRSYAYAQSQQYVYDQSYNAACVYTDRKNYGNSSNADDNYYSYSYDAGANNAGVTESQGNQNAYNYIGFPETGYF